MENINIIEEEIKEVEEPVVGETAECGVGEADTMKVAGPYDITVIEEEPKGLTGKGLALAIGGGIALGIAARKAWPKIKAKIEEGKERWFQKRGKFVIEEQEYIELYRKAAMWDNYQETLGEDDEDEEKSED